MAPKTYLTAPDFTYKPTGPIQIGALLLDPFRPTQPLSPAPSPPPDIETIVEHQHELSRHSGRSLNGSLWSYFLAAAGGELGGNISKNSSESYSIDVLETRRLVNPPVDDDASLRDRLGEPQVKAAMKAGLYGLAPVYLVTGVKIARGLRVSKEEWKEVGGTVGSSIPISEAVGVTVGAEVGTGRSWGTKSSYKTGDDDVVFAYQVHVVKVRGIKNKRIVVDPYKSREALLHDTDNNVDELDKGFEVGLDLQDLGDAADEQEIQLDTEEFVDDDGEKHFFVCAKDV